MQTLHFVLTIVAVAACLLAVFHERKALQHRDVIRERARELQSVLGKVDMTSEENAVLKQRLDKLAGRFYRSQREDTRRECADPWHTAEHYVASTCPGCGQTWAPGPVETAEQTRARLRLAHGLPKVGPLANGAGAQE